jgi:hypothetical protein
MDTVDQLSDQINNVLKPIFTDKVSGSVISLIIVLYAGLAAPKLPKSIANLFKSRIFKIIILSFIAYTASKNASIAIISTVALVISMQTLSKQEEANGLVTQIEKEIDGIEDVATDVVTDTEDAVEDVVLATESVTESDNKVIEKDHEDHHEDHHEEQHEDQHEDHHLDEPVEDHMEVHDEHDHHVEPHVEAPVEDHMEVHDEHHHHEEHEVKSTKKIVSEYNVHPYSSSDNHSSIIEEMSNTGDNEYSIYGLPVRR